MYVDESSQTGCTYMVLGALVIEQSASFQLDSRLEKFKHQWRLDHELKWGKVSRGMLGAYKGYVEVGLDVLRRDSPGFYAIVVDCTKLDHNTYNGGSSETGFSKFVYQLLMKCARLFHERAALDCFLDDRTTRQTLHELRSILNNGASKNFSRRPFRRVEYRDSKQSNLIQLVDLLTGAVAYQWNRKHLEPGASPARIALAESIARKVGLRCLHEATPAGRDAFSIWKFAASPRRAPGRA